MPRGNRNRQHDRPPPYSAGWGGDNTWEYANAGDTSWDNVNQSFGNLQIDEPAPQIAPLRMVVGVDFGTTNTAVSYAPTAGNHEKNLDDVIVVHNWPGGNGSHQTPSRYAYAKENLKYDLEEDVWGHEVEPQHISYAWMKLNLDPEQKTKYDDPSLFESEGAGVLANPLGQIAVQTCADFLAGIADFAFDAIAKEVQLEVLRTCPIDFYFTVPAVWSDRAKADTLRAAQKAAKKVKLGCHSDSRIFLIREPEAAAIAALSAYTRGGADHQIKVGDSILVCDCGGGTVDLTSYVVTGISPKLTFKELLAGIGGKCGATYIDREFIRWMEEKFGEKYSNLSWAKRGPASQLMKEFEAVKTNFSLRGRPNKVSRIASPMTDVPDSDFYSFDDTQIKLRSKDLKEMFDPVVAKIKDLLQQQLDVDERQHRKVTIKKIILVGGFGESPYLFDVLQPWCGERGIKLVCPDRAQTAIARGATLSGLLDIQPTSRRSRAHYGLAVHEHFDPLRHRIRDQFVWDWDGSLRADNNMSWHLSKGDMVDEDTSIKFEMVRLIYEYGNKVFQETIYCSDDDDAPLFVDDRGVKKLATISQDFSGVNLNTFPSKYVNGMLARMVTCQYTIHFGHRRGVLCFSTLVNGKEVGKTTITFDGQNGNDVGNGIAASSSYSPPCAMQ